jgi:hypothetical protein
MNPPDNHYDLPPTMHKDLRERKKTRGRKTVEMWRKYAKNMEEAIESGKTLEDLAQEYGVAGKQIRRVLPRIGIEYAAYREKSKVKRDNVSKQEWLAWECKRLRVEAWHKEAMALYLSIPDHCPVTGKPLLFSCSPKAAYPNRAMLTVLDGEVGYTEGNVEVLSLIGVYYMTRLPKDIWKPFSKYLTDRAKMCHTIGV